MDFGTYKLAGFFMAVSAVLHLFAVLVSGFSSDAMTFVPIGVVYGFLAWGVSRGSRALSYLTFLITLFGMSVAMGGMGALDIPYYWLAMIALADFLVAVNLFVRLWQKA